MTPKRILVVEDSPDTRDLLRLHLSMEGYNVFEAEDGQEGLSKVSKLNPHLIITDLSMPRLGGTDMIKRLREQRRYKDTPIVAITAHSFEMADAARHAGADVVLAKPLMLDLLALVVRELLY